MDAHSNGRRAGHLAGHSVIGHRQPSVPITIDRHRGVNERPTIFSRENIPVHSGYRSPKQLDRLPHAIGNDRQHATGDCMIGNTRQQIR
jgi:hypothetical protein